MIKWEYKELNSRNDDCSEDEINKLGLEGWELVNFFHYTSVGIYVVTYHFKKPIKTSLIQRLKKCLN